MPVKIMQTKGEKAVAAFVILLLVAAIALPIYISSLDPDENRQGDVSGQTGSSTGHQQQTPEGGNPRQTAFKSNGSVYFENGEFMLNGTGFKILSGAVHYFRTVPRYWTDRLQKLKACGLNTVETYVPWNLHEPYPGEFNFNGILDVRAFLKKAQELGLYVIFRPGPYICSEWDFGGLPAWLLSDPEMQVRSNYPGYLTAVERFFNKLLPMVEDLQYSNGGPIIAFQVENEFGSYSSKVEHLQEIKKQFLNHGLTEMLITSDNIWGVHNDPFYTEALPTANFKDIKEGRQVFEQIKAWSPEFPLMVTEFWTGWFDHWTSEHEGLAVSEYAYYLEEILKENASVNFYMFHGGTNFGFMNGANHDKMYKPDVSSYDYDALLTEKGDITPKYLKTRELLWKYVLEPQGLASLPPIPGNTKSKSYGSILTGQVEALSFEDLLKVAKTQNLPKPVPMEMLKTYNGSGQNFGYILYRKQVSRDSKQLAFANQPADRAQIFVDGSLVATLGWNTEALTASLKSPNTTSVGNSKTLDILVENNGRVNYGTESSGVLNNQRKGIKGEVTVDGHLLSNVTAYQLDFNPNVDLYQTGGWKNNSASSKLPALFKGTLTINGSPEDTFVYMQGWGKGIVMVNGYNLGRYWSRGPQQTLYLPAPILKTGQNQVMWFETDKVGEAVVFTDTPILDVNDPTTIKL